MIKSYQKVQLLKIKIDNCYNIFQRDNLILKFLNEAYNTAVGEAIRNFPNHKYQIGYLTRNFFEQDLINLNKWLQKANEIPDLEEKFKDLISNFIVTSDFHGRENH